MKTQDEVAKSAEMCVIGAMLIDEKALANVIQTLKPEHFYFDELKATYQAILELSSEGKSIDFVSVLKKLVAKGIYDEKQAKQMLFECADLVPSVSQVESYAKTVIDSFKARRLQEIGARLGGGTRLRQHRQSFRHRERLQRLRGRDGQRTLPVGPLPEDHYGQLGNDENRKDTAQARDPSVG